MTFELRTIIVLGAVTACQHASTSAGEQAATAVICFDTDAGVCTDGDCDPGGGPAAPKTLPGTTPIHQTFPSKGAGGKISFDCYGACGASCDLVNKVTLTKTQCVEWQACGATYHRTDTYDVIIGDSHPFCKWHDACYLYCGQQFGDGATNINYQACTAQCDYGCIEPTKYNAWAALVTGFGTAGPIPPPFNWSYSDCVVWGATKVVQAKGLTSRTGRITFSEFKSSTAATKGGCDPTQPVNAIDCGSLDEAGCDPALGCGWNPGGTDTGPTLDAGCYGFDPSGAGAPCGGMTESACDSAGYCTWDPGGQLPSVDVPAYCGGSTGALDLSAKEL